MDGVEVIEVWRVRAAITALRECARERKSRAGLPVLGSGFGLMASASNEAAEMLEAMLSARSQAAPKPSCEKSTADRREMALRIAREILARKASLMKEVERLSPDAVAKIIGVKGGLGDYEGGAGNG